jgi:hypothetical protein
VSGADGEVRTHKRPTSSQCLHLYCLQISPPSRSPKPTRRRLLLYSLLSAVAHLHAGGLALGGFTTDQLRLAAPGLLRLAPLRLLPRAGIAAHAAAGPRMGAHAAPCMQPHAAHGAHATPDPLLLEPRWDLPALVSMWRRRIISNLEYILWLNLFAGRRLGDRGGHAFVPWVIDFTAAVDEQSMAGEQGRGLLMGPRAAVRLIISPVANSRPLPHPTHSMRARAVGRGQLGSFRLARPDAVSAQDLKG